MHIENIKEFVMLAEKISIPETADELYVSPATLSRHLRKMEDEMGMQLFDRTSRKLLLNKNGKQFLPYAYRIVTAYEEYQKLLKTQGYEIIHRLSIGVEHTIAQFDFEEIIKDFQKEGEMIRQDIQTNSNAELLSLFNMGKYDFAFVWGDGNERYSSPHLCYRRDYLSLVVPATHRFAHRSKVSLNELGSEIFIMLPDEEISTGEIREKFRDIGLQPRVELTAKLESSLIDIVSSGYGITVVNRKHAIKMASTYPDVSVVDIEPKIYENLNIIYREQRIEEYAYCVFFEYLRNRSMESQ